MRVCPEFRFPSTANYFSEHLSNSCLSSTTNDTGVRPLTAVMLIAEIGDIKRFPSVKQLAAFAGLDSAVHESRIFKSKKFDSLPI
ncbi:transposase [Paenibacillus glacialis]|uniref:transposase n=1 Tax=Paenibacillus glacialis TaxID=494026 RepID=UPI003CCC1782